MTTQGLFINQNGQDFLLTTEFHHEMKTHRLIVLQRVKGEWQQLTGIQEKACRESLIAAFVDFFVDICRVLNSTGWESEMVSASTPMSRRSRIRASSKPNLWTIR